MKLLPFGILIKDFFGVYVLTPFEKALIGRLSDALSDDDKNILADQMKHFNVVRRLIRHLDVPNAHGFTNFHTVRFGKDITASLQMRRFASSTPEALLATAHVTFFEGQIDVQFWLVRGVLFRIEYRSLSRIYYPPSKYSIDDVVVWPVNSN